MKTDPCQERNRDDGRIIPAMYQNFNGLADEIVCECRIIVCSMQHGLR